MGTWNSVSVASDSSMTLCTNLPVQWILTQTHLINGIPNAHISAAQELSMPYPSTGVINAVSKHWSYQCSIQAQELSMPYPSTVVCSCNTSKATFQSRETHCFPGLNLFFSWTTLGYENRICVQTFLILHLALFIFYYSLYIYSELLPWCHCYLQVCM